MIAGSLLVFVVLRSAGTDGHASWPAICAGFVFVLAGGILFVHAAGWMENDGLLHRLLVALLLTAFAAVAMIFPPGGVIVAFLAVNGWMAVYRKIHQRVTGRDPLAGLSQEKQLGVGCLVTIGLSLLRAGHGDLGPFRVAARGNAAAIARPS